ncbi:MAG: tetratricopeptide repeat protein [Treponema sp.]|jgi:tetratricopeptide (TPR) repeat protein|nr:tetratricopeptide repeat protein [Treponema sp.]
MEELEGILANFNESIQMLENARKAGMPSEMDLAICYNRRGMLYFQVNMFDESITDFDKSIEIIEQMRSEGKQFNENELANAYSCRGMMYHVIGEFDQALPDLSKSIEIWERFLDSGIPIDESMLFNMYIMRGGTLNRICDHIDDAISDYQKSIKLAESILNAGEPFDDGFASAYMGLGQSYDQKEEFFEANEHYNKCIKIWEQMQNEGQELSGESEGSLAMAYMNRGANHHSLNENDKALADYNKSISIREGLQKKGVEQDVFDLVMVYGNRALVYKDGRNIRAAINDYIFALRALKEEFEEHPELQEVYYDTLDKAIELIAYEKDKTLHSNVIQEFLYSMRSVPKTEEAEEAQNNILEQLE